MKKFLTLTLLSLLVGVSAKATVTIYVQNADTSTKPAIHIWNSTNLDTNWEKPTELDEGTITINGMYFYYKTFNEDSFSFLIHTNGDTDKTDNFIISEAGEYFYWWHPTYNDQSSRGGSMNCSGWTSRTLTSYWMCEKWPWATAGNVYVYTSNPELYGASTNSNSEVSYLGERDKYVMYKWAHSLNCTDSYISSLLVKFENNNSNNYNSDNGLSYATDVYYKNYVASGSGITYSRTFASTNGSTVCLPFALTVSEAAEYGKFYALKSADGGNVVFSAVEETEACVPYFFVPKAADVTISSEGKTIEFDLSKMDVTKNGVTFSGTLAAVSQSDVYGFQSGELVYAASAVNIPEFRAYLTAGAGAKLSLSFEDETGINTISRSNNDNVYYDLQGRRVANPTKGLFIVNGKKVIK